MKLIEKPMYVEKRRGKLVKYKGYAVIVCKGALSQYISSVCKTLQYSVFLSTLTKPMLVTIKAITACNKAPQPDTRKSTELIYTSHAK